jgi:hypothetical protein
MRESLEPPSTTEARSDAPRDPLTVYLWFEVERGMQASLHLGSSVHRFTGTRQLVAYLLELAEEPEIFEVSSEG